jgi:hypothetical protein
LVLVERKNLQPTQTHKQMVLTLFLAPSLPWVVVSAEVTRMRLQLVVLAVAAPTAKHHIWVQQELLVRAMRVARVETTEPILSVVAAVALVAQAYQTPMVLVAWVATVAWVLHRQ